MKTINLNTIEFPFYCKDGCHSFLIIDKGSFIHVTDLFSCEAIVYSRHTNELVNYSPVPCAREEVEAAFNRVLLKLKEKI